MKTQKVTVAGEHRSAVISHCGFYRYELRRIWAVEKSRPSVITFIGLNPSTADAVQDDPTIRRCRGFAKSWGYEGMIMVNLFAFRATQPSEMMKAEDPIGPENNDHISMAVNRADRVVAAWGADGEFMGRGAQVIIDYCPYVKCFGITKNRQPKHPLYLSSKSGLRKYTDLV